jgi:N-acetylneuraminate synthase
MPPYVIAEISGNHCGSIHRAKELIYQAKKAGADAVKTQCYDPDTITLDINRPDFIVQGGHWAGRSLYELYGKAHTPLGWHDELYHSAAAEGIPIFSSVFDRTSVDLLERLGCPAYKIASFEIVDTPLIEYVAKTGKPMIISTGLANDKEVLDANTASGRRAAFLHCTSEYPGTLEHASLSSMSMLDQLLEFHNPIGISDHTMGSLIPIAATALGAVIIEKHLKLPHGARSEDDAFSLTPKEFAAMVGAVRETHEAMKTRPLQTEGRQLRRSLYVVADIAKGEEFSHENVRSIRPGYGAPPRKLHQMIGQKAEKSYHRGDRLP